MDLSHNVIKYRLEILYGFGLGKNVETIKFLVSCAAVLGDYQIPCNVNFSVFDVLRKVCCLLSAILYYGGKSLTFLGFLGLFGNGVLSATSSTHLRLVFPFTDARACDPNKRRLLSLLLNCATVGLSFPPFI